MNILVIGGQGFIGSHICNLLLASGHRLRVLTRATKAMPASDINLQIMYGDFSDQSILKDALDGMDAVVHCASATVPGTAAHDPHNDVSSNLLPTITLLNAMLIAGVKRLLYLSSGGTVYGIPSLVPTPETHALNPTHSYGIVKVACEGYIRNYAQIHNFQATIIRPSNPYGPGQVNNGAQGLIGTTLYKILHNMPVEIWGDGQTVRDYIYIEDLARICVTALLDGKMGIFNAGSGVGVSINWLMEEIRQVVGSNFQLNYTEGRSIDVPVSVLDMSYSMSELHYAPQFSLREGLAQHWSWIRSTQN